MADVPAPLARVLDGLNTLDTLERLRRAAVPRGLTYGPKVVSAGRGQPLSAGAVIWRRAPGYYGFKTLTLIGVWAVSDAEANIDIRVGLKPLPFRAPFFDADAYHKLIKRDYAVYYADDGTPPPVPTFAARYQPADRLALREQVAAALAALM